MFTLRRLAVTGTCVALVTLAACSSSSTAGGSSSTSSSSTTSSSSSTNSSAAGSDTNSGSSGSSSSSSGGGSGSCTPKHTSIQTVASGKLTVSVYVSPPYTVQDGDNSFSGVDGQIVTKIAAMECLTLDGKAGAAAGLIANVESNRTDMAIGGLYYTADRAKILSLSTPMYRDGMALLSKDGVSSIDQLSGKTVGVIQGYLWNAELQAALGAGNVKLYQSSDSMLADLKNGRLDVGVLTSAEAGYRAKQAPQLKSATIAPTAKVKSSQGANNVVIAMPPRNTSLTTAVNDDIKSLIADGSIASILTNNGMDPKLASGTN